MARIIFTVMGDRVQDVGYRLFLLQGMKERQIVGFPIDLSGGKQVSIRAWGVKHELEDFYDYIKREKPASIGKTEVSPKIIDNEPKPSSFALLNEKMDLMVEQTAKFVAHGKSIEKILQKMPKKIGKEVSAAIKQS